MRDGFAHALHAERLSRLRLHDLQHRGIRRLTAFDDDSHRADWLVQIGGDIGAGGGGHKEHGDEGGMACPAGHAALVACPALGVGL